MRVARVPCAMTREGLSIPPAKGEGCKRQWAAAPRPEPTQSARTTASTDEMSSVWDAIYGQGFYVAHVLGARLYARTLLTGNRGTTLKFEMYKHDEDRTDNVAVGIKGVAKDSSENIYKVTF